MAAYLPDAALYIGLIYCQFSGILDTKGFWILLIAGTLAFKLTSEAAYGGKANSFALQGTLHAFMYRLACAVCGDGFAYSEICRIAVILVSMISIVLVHKYFSKQFTGKLKEVTGKLQTDSKDNELHKRKKEILHDLITLADYENFVTYSTHLDKVMTNRPTTTRTLKERFSEWVARNIFGRIYDSRSFKSFREYKYNKRTAMARILNAMYFVDKNSGSVITFHESQFNLDESRWEFLRLAAFRWLMELAYVAAGVQLIVK